MILDTNFTESNETLDADLGEVNVVYTGDGTIDQTYKPTSANAQSGKAVAEAVNGKQDFFALVSGENNDKILTFMGGATIGTSGDISINSGGRTSIGAATGETLNLWGDRIEIHGEIQAFRDIDFPYGNGKITNLVTPNGTDPTQAANVEYVAQHTSKERRMKLIADHTVTAEEAGEAEAWELSMSKINNGIPLDKVHIVYDIPNSTTITSNTTISARINGGDDLGSYLNYVYVAKNAYGSFWVEAEKIAENKWRNVRTQINSNITNSALYANYFLDSVDVIDSIKIFGIAFKGINIKVWGRDAT